MQNVYRQNHQGTSEEGLWARKAALKKDPEFRAFEEEQEKLRKEAVKRQEREEETP